MAFSTPCSERFKIGKMHVAEKNTLQPASWIPSRSSCSCISARLARAQNPRSIPRRMANKADQSTWISNQFVMLQSDTSCRDKCDLQMQSKPNACGYQKKTYKTPLLGHIFTRTGLSDVSLSGRNRQIGSKEQNNTKSDLISVSCYLTDGPVCSACTAWIYGYTVTTKTQAFPYTLPDRPKSVHT